MAESSKIRKKSKEEREREKLSNTAFANNAYRLFKKAKDIVNAQEQGHLRNDAKQILEQMLHSILFLGHIHAAVYTKKYIFPDKDTLHRTMKVFPKPFKCFGTHVAQRTPFSYFLQLVKKCYKGHKKTVMTILSELLADCKKSGNRYPLISRVICICEYNNRRYYGASLSCEGEREREIMTSVSCLKVWHHKISSAVMSKFQQDTGPPHTIQLPATVRCEAFDVEDMSQVKPPCGRCNELYSLPGHTDILNQAGNCAETEAISNLLQDQEGVSEQTIITREVYGDQEIKDRMTACFNQTMSNINMKKKKAHKYNIQKVYD